jgi:hypothetical protein
MNDGALDAPEAVEALEELAMAREHRDKNITGALDWCRLALGRLRDGGRWPYGFRERYRARFEHRRARLLRKLRRTEVDSGEPWFEGSLEEGIEP